jgi:hypothetical protein
MKGQPGEERAACPQGTQGRRHFGACPEIPSHSSAGTARGFRGKKILKGTKATSLGRGRCFNQSLRFIGTVRINCEEMGFFGSLADSDAVNGFWKRSPDRIIGIQPSIDMVSCGTIRGSSQANEAKRRAEGRSSRVNHHDFLNSSAGLSARQLADEGSCIMKRELPDLISHLAVNWLTSDHIK